MASPTLLKTYRAVRDLVGDVHQTAAVDEHLGRFQIHGSEEGLALAIAQTEGLAAQVEQLESNLRRCARRGEHTHSVQTGECAPIRAKSRGTCVMIRTARSAASVAVVIALLWMPSTKAAFAHEELIGAPVYAADGLEVGRVADVSTTGSIIDALRVSRGAPMGLGERFVIIPQPAFMIRGRRIDLPDLRAEDVDLFPHASSFATESGTEDH